MQVIAELTVHMARENPRWGYTTIRGALFHVGHDIARETVRNILKEHGIVPAPERRKRTPWSTFLKSHWECISAADLFTVEIWSLGGLIRYHVFFFIKLSTRRVHIAGITHSPSGSWMQQIVRNVTERPEGIEGGTLLLVGTDSEGLLETISVALTAGDESVGRIPLSMNPYGDGHASERVAGAVAWRLGLGSRPADWDGPELAETVEPRSRLNV